MKRVLVVEDEAAIREFIMINLKRNGYEAVEAETGEAALRIFAEQNGNFEIAILDIMMPGIDGLAVCREIRKASAIIGIIMLTARTQESDKINGFSQGADDYVTKPFSPSELVMRVDSLYRRVESNLNTSKSEANQVEILKNGEFALNLRRRTCSKNDKNIELTQVEYQIMEYFFTCPEEELDRTDILNRVWGESYYGEEKIVDVNIRRLRIKIEDEPSTPKHILTVWGRGYKWQS